MTTAADADSAPPGVLILHSNQRPTAAGIVIEDTLRTVVPGALRRPVGLYSEYLDEEWSSIKAYGREQAEFFRQKYSGRNIRVVVAAAPQALQFSAAYRDQMFPGVPVVHIAIPREMLERTTFPPDIVGNSVNLDPTATLELALQLHPDAKRLVIVLGADQRDRAWETRLRAAVGRLGRHPEVEYFAGLQTAEVLRRIGALPRDTIVFTPGYFMDVDGQVGTPRRSLELIAPASTAPVYGFVDTHLGTGIVGGYMTPYDEQAKQAGAIIVRLLNGTAPAMIAPSSMARVSMVDWRQVRRWGIDPRKLPADTVVMFREPSVWDSYRWQIVATALALVAQAFLIVTLVVQRRRRRLAELEVQRQRMELSHASRLATLGELSASIAHEVNQPLGAISGNVDAVELLLEAAPPRLDDAKRVLLDLKKANQRASDVVRRIRELLRKRELECEPYDLNGAASDVIRLLDAETARRRVEVVTDFGPLPVVRGDRLQFQQVLLNMMMNGMDAMADTQADERRLAVRTTRNENGEAEVTVTDTGHGFPEGDSRRLFDSFFTTKPDGMGLGLALCRSIVQAHGGRIWALNNPGGGATFQFTLPIRADARAH